ncbi:MAG: P1 family peptidase [Candidatus Wallbacteria bacterium]|nr:P1 family peptidase [Candidatus Wallbacteria bacterium]
MRIAVAYNLPREDSPQFRKDYEEIFIDEISTVIRELGDTPVPIEVSGKPDFIAEKILSTEPDMIFNLADGNRNKTQMAFYPSLFEQQGIPYIGSNSNTFHISFSSFLFQSISSSHKVLVPDTLYVKDPGQKIRGEIDFPVLIKPHKLDLAPDIKRDILVDNPKKYREKIRRMLSRHPEGLVLESFIRGRKIRVLVIEGMEKAITAINFSELSSGRKKKLPDLTELEPRLNTLAVDIFKSLAASDFGEIIFIRNDEGELYFVNFNPMPSLFPESEYYKYFLSKGMDFRFVIRSIIQSAKQRYKIYFTYSPKPPFKARKLLPPRSTVRELGLEIGIFPTGKFNAITDVKGVKVGHLTYVEDNVEIPGSAELTSVRTGVTAILPTEGNIYEHPFVAGGFVLNGIGEMIGLNQVMEWGWIESPIVLTNTMSVGEVHTGIVSYMTSKYSGLGTISDVIIPVVGETDDSFLHDVRVKRTTPNDAIRALNRAKGGPVIQGSIGAGTGMTTFDFAGGIGSSSRMLPIEEGGYTIGVLVLSNFGNMRNLTIDGAVVGRELDKLYEQEIRRNYSYGSIIVVIATDAPLIAGQLNRICKRAALGLGRVGSHAATTSGEIIIAFSTGNRFYREARGKSHYQTMKFLSISQINSFYEAVIEATEEAVLNAIFCSNGMDGRSGRFCPSIPHDRVLDILRRGRKV